jgi:hypothetical protein
MSGLLAFFKTLWEIIKAIKLAWSAWLEHRANLRRKKFEDGVATGDSKKVEESFDSDKAGKPSGNDVDVFDD